MAILNDTKALIDFTAELRQALIRTRTEIGELTYTREHELDDHREQIDGHTAEMLQRWHTAVGHTLELVKYIDIKLEG